LAVIDFTRKEGGDRWPNALQLQQEVTVAAQDPLDPGVLILSKFAGAAEQLTGAVIVNPNDKLEVAEAIRDALQMTHQERIIRWQDMIGPVRDRDVSWWAAAFLKELAAKESEARRNISKLTQPRLPESDHAAPAIE
jgi:trehalose 6-phosphate synthase